jgi:hypothetical protein
MNVTGKKAVTAISEHPHCVPQPPAGGIPCCGNAFRPDHQLGKPRNIQLTS